ncbi:thiamine pyrophosphate-dependent enzyme [Accumulibacter sp.]|uniref:thiamine pyrophosphate-dependent enzyme n=1 Tax=Accumulibacter sp. TaxID=2053492 RepID=UPI0025F94B5A|nr:thiamine pyrophosphate-dependent enzyme [Accumulibacter sp.]MCM8596691.1 thiamine pyrophosphate-dependent enzyme [Accumulibacter sp.]MCM8624775.1 thiamine pyrophosphate-dependent enzyme [Accumulibacter sp.]MDS4050839.1 thiamine pyrophosphate-dependent enzyme [Accumulibacter sp.]
MSEARYRSLRELPGVHALAAGTAMCAGCGGLEALHEVLDVLGTRTVVINAAGCMTLLASYPFTPFHGSWLYTSMASAPAGAQGVRDALDLLRSRGRIGADDDLTAVVLSGDGSAYGMGLSATSAAIERGLDFIYLCYDNEGYGNTGQQTSAATPHGARTPTSPGPAGHAGEKKDLFDVWVAHRPRYAATVIGAEPLDLARKVQRAASLAGPRLILALAPCPTGWDYDPMHGVDIGRLAVRTGIWPLKEYVDGAVVHTHVPHPRLPVEAYLSTQGRFRHLFEPLRNDALIGEIQQRVDRYWQNVG